MNDTDLLKRIRIASPCPAAWDEMTGDERQRFCATCQKHVYNLSAMTAGEAVALVRATEGNICGRFYRRRDGTILTADCPVGLAAFWRGTRRVVCTSAAVVALMMSACWAMGQSRYSRGSVQALSNRMSMTFEETMWKIKSWFGFAMPMGQVAVMGDVMICPPPQPQSTNETQKTE